MSAYTETPTDIDGHAAYWGEEEPPRVVRINNHAQTIALEGMLLEHEETVRNIECPECRGTGTLAITRIEAGLLYCCHRASCSLKGLIPTLSSGRASAPKKFKPREFTRPLIPLPDGMAANLCAAYGLTWREMVLDNGWRLDYTQDRIYMPIFGHPAYPVNIGAQCKSWCGLSPKILTYLWKPSVKLHFPAIPQWRSGQPIVLVEDIISSIKVAQHAGACALLGTNLNIEQAQFLRKLTNHIIFMLDPDAQGKAITLKQKYGLYFRRCDVVVLETDPKDSTEEALHQTLKAVFKS